MAKRVRLALYFLLENGNGTDILMRRGSTVPYHPTAHKITWQSSLGISQNMLRPVPP